MIKKLSALLSEEISLKLNSSDDDKEIYAYSFEVILSLLINICILTVVAFIIEKIAELIIFTIFFSGLRVYAGGYHAKTHIECFSVTLIIFLISALSNTYLIAYGEIILAVGILFSIIMVFLLAPTENENKPLSKNERKKYKVISRIIVITLSLAVVVLYFVRVNTDYVYITAVVAMVIESVSLLKK
ncbi:accessory gene regulator B family protein [Sedimentibacter sp.]|uniref:accessory gene regulator ArgB-like protein n=1 Tax=Sedimentibacter sp. TaxID=1960295 RepID=UPI0028A95DF1|nr:accessory gene regulator B family protein [Sedimentibacter sp.]